MSDLAEILDSEEDVILPEPGGIGAIVKSEVEAQITAAHRYPRSMRRFLKESEALATLTEDVAASCLYSVPRDGKMITGPSVRLAEIMASSYGNMHVAARTLEPDERSVSAQGVAWDLEKNLRVSIEVSRRITGKTGRRYGDDMIQTTGMAAASIAFRNAVFRVIPRAYVQHVYGKAREVAVGDASTLTDRRAKLFERLQKLGVPPDRICPRMGVAGVEDIGLEHLEQLIGLGTAIKSGSVSIDEAFPPVAPVAPPAPPVEDGKRVSLRKKAEPKPAEPDPEPGANG